LDYMGRAGGVVTQHEKCTAWLLAKKQSERKWGLLTECARL